MKIVMMGTGPFAVPTFKWLLESEHDCSLLVTRPQVVNRGRKSPPGPMRIAGEENQIEIFDPADINTAESIETLKAFEADLLIVCDYGQILSNEALSTAKLGGINLHGSLLPKYRGAAPVQWSVYNGDPVTGVCVIHMTPKLDGGPIISQQESEILHDDTAETLEDRLSQMGVNSVQEAIDKLSGWDGASVLGQLQDQTLVTKAPRLKKQMGQIDWNRTAIEIRNQIRAFKPWPGCYSQFQRNGKDVKVIFDWVELVEKAALEAAGELPVSEPGQVALVDGKSMWLQTGDGYLSVTKIQPVGKRVMDVDEFLRGYQVQLGTRFGDQ